MLTFLPLEEIDAMDKWEGAELNKAKEILAFELTSLVHGEEEAKKHRRLQRHYLVQVLQQICLRQNLQRLILQMATLIL